jgi:acid stress-induced BolA-like protein IbaG/YrbA
MSGWGNVSVVDLVERRIREALNPQSVRVEPTFGDPNGAHVSIRVIGECFEGKRAVARHQMVYRAIWKEMDAGLVHAVDSLETLTPEEVNK